MGFPERYTGFQKQVNQLTIHKSEIKSRFLKRTARETQLISPPHPSHACKPDAPAPTNLKTSTPIACPVPTAPPTSVTQTSIERAETPSLLSRLFNMKPQ